MKVVTRLESSGPGEDRVIVEHADGRTLIVIADGAGGTGRGAAAAEMACSMVAAAFRRGAMSSDSWVAELAAIDRNVLTGALGGQTTVVAVEIDGTEVRGASVGDSGCWAIDSLGFVDLTSSQDRKPLLGTGLATPRGIGPTTLPARLLVATDGLLKYCPKTEIDRIAVTGTLEGAVEKLISRVRLRSGNFQDDVAIALCDSGIAG
jgi:serine/threonine protein phosphatase PrpC